MPSWAWPSLVTALEMEPRRSGYFWPAGLVVHLYSFAEAGLVYRRGFRVCRMHGARGGAPTGKRNGNFREGTRTKEAMQAVKLITRFARKS